MPVYVVTVSGEIPLRSSRTRPRFYRRLVENLRDAVERAGGRVLGHEVVEAKVVLRTDVDVTEALSKVFGVHRVGVVAEYQFKDLKDLVAWASSEARDLVANKRFAVRVKRSGSHDFTSLDVAREVGAALKEYSAGVDLENPEVTVEIEVRGSRAFIYKRAAEGPGGLPVGVEGRALALFSGGFDSPVAAWLVAKRGVQVDFLHFTLGSTRATYLAFKVARELSSKWLHGYRPRFVVVDFRKVVAEVASKVSWPMRQVVLRALMYTAASRLAVAGGYNAIVTGESIGQASSQTLRNLQAVEEYAKPSRPVLRPLLGFDKEEIVALSRRIGFYELSSKVPEACAIAPSRVETHATAGMVEEEVRKVDMSLVEKAVEGARSFDTLSSRPDDVIPSDDVEIDFIPEDALLVDAREWRGVDDGSLPGAIPLSRLDPDNVPRDKVVVVFCDTGAISTIVAEMLRKKGLRAYSLRGGLKRCGEGG
ncbi:thiamine biosynthesis protein ThiI [Thermogladius calderae 1633]|uniref:tRNA sulfurtransferase n=1 Tax=Thermogladius calderae (strain DSM 22663 / VKM B-2946 / 1633) TaxID=1184251 RepID=I3TF49_THEC1|nr:tRNA uracil 4-sulfurtransferase ThiI [Thermogladius calderae]AFK51387.1 thiamine biosynthesis protein ThiI [Thermogladius calderae 1633]